jgi:hypothetical protein
MGSPESHQNDKLMSSNISANESQVSFNLSSQQSIKANDTSQIKDM